jgi:hypothetical protein
LIFVAADFYNAPLREIFLIIPETTATAYKNRVEKLRRDIFCLLNELARSKLRGIETLYDNFLQSCHPRMFLSGVQSEFRLDSRSWFDLPHHDPEQRRMGQSMRE